MGIVIGAIYWDIGNTQVYIPHFQQLGTTKNNSLLPNSFQSLIGTVFSSFFRACFPSWSSWAPSLNVNFNKHRFN